MSDKLVINLHPAILNYSGQPPIRSLRKSVHSSSLCGTNISSSSKSGCITLDYPIPVPYSRIRSSKNSAIFYSKLLRPEGGFADKYPKGKTDLNGFLNQKQSAATAGRVCRNCQVHILARRYSKSEPQLEGGFEPDLNYFLTPIANAPTVGVEFESNCSRTTVNQAKMRPPQTLCTLKVEDAECFTRRGGAERFLRSINHSKILFQSQELSPLHSTAHLSKLIFCFYPINNEKKVWRFMQEAVNPTTSIKIDHQNIFIGFGGGAEGGGGSGPFVPDSFCVCAAVNMRYPQAIHSPTAPGRALPLPPFPWKVFEYQNQREQNDTLKNNPQKNMFILCVLCG